jgi:hypothetical protein
LPEILPIIGSVTASHNLPIKMIIVVAITGKPSTRTKKFINNRLKIINAPPP